MAKTTPGLREKLISQLHKEAIPNVIHETEQLGRFERLSQTWRDGRATIVLVHPVGGSLFCYRRLAAELGTDHNVAGIEGLPPKDGRQTTYAERANQYVQMIKQNLPSGPAVIGGWSVGGLITWEMSVNIPDCPLVIIDSVWPTEQMSTPTAKQLRTWFIEDLCSSRSEWSNNIGDFEQFYINGNFEDAACTLGIDIALLSHYFDIFKDNGSAFSSHTPTQSPGVGTILYGRNTDPYIWQTVGGSKMNTIDIVLGHYEVLENPGSVKTVATAFRSFTRQKTLPSTCVIEGSP